jgi:radical SAM superfamily enzyme YgiQ (UPF0313 family)
MANKHETDRRKRLDVERSFVKIQRHAPIAVALVYPNTYHVGMSNLGFQTVYRLLNELDGIVCERSFLPDHAASHTGDIISIESKRPLSSFDILALSVSFENDYPNLLTLFEKARLPFRSIHRDESHPLIIAGGVTSLLNPAPLAPFVDCCFIGEAEVILPPFMELFQTAATREELLLRASQELAGIYAPGFYRERYDSEGMFQALTPLKDVPPVIRRAYVPDISQVPACSAILTPDTTFDQSFLIEVSRGCPHGCRFCGAGFVYRPPRFRDNQLLKSCIHTGRTHTDKIGLVGAAVSDLPGLNQLCNIAEDLGTTVSFSSLRADALDACLISHLSKSGVKTATIAPDAGSERMRRCINKGITESDILAAAEALVANDIPNLKLYFMIGLPTETMDDIEAILTLCKKIKHVFLKTSRPRGRIGEITVSVNSFVPKPHTPFQWAAMDDIQTLKQKHKHIKRGLGRVANIRVHADVPRWAYLQALFSRGDGRVADILEAAHANQGNWPLTLKNSLINADFYVRRERSGDENFPWDFIDHGIHKSYLLAEYRKAMRGVTTEACEVSTCRRCGVC